MLSDGQARSWAGRVWRHRAEAEAVSAARYTRLAHGLRAIAAPTALVERARAAAEDEARHRGLCADAALQLGVAKAPIEAPPRWRPLRSEDDVVREALAFCAISESLNATLLAVSLERSEPSWLRDLLRGLLRDEVQHARLGWAIATWQAERRSLAHLTPWIAPTLRDAVSEELLAERDEAPAAAISPRDRGLGLWTATERVELIAATLRDVVCPGLEGLGLDGSEAREWVATTLVT